MKMKGFQQTDPSGLETLELFSEAPNFNQWLFDTIAPFCKGQVLEIGSGIGNISNLILKKNENVVLSDLRKEYCDNLKDKFNQNPHLKGVHEINIALPDFENAYSQLLDRFDTVIALNVVEHIKDDSLAISNCKKLLKNNGHLIVLVPAYQKLYNSFDKELGHFRRYTHPELNQLLEKEEMNIIYNQYFNIAGIAGWIFSGSMLNKRIIPRKQLSIYDKAVPLLRKLDGLARFKFGLSVIAIATKMK